MQTQIHSTALVHADAELDTGVSIGPYSIVEAGVTVGAGTQILARAHLMTGCSMGRNNEVHPGCVLGNTPQDRAFQSDTQSFLEIGDDNIFRENVTMHRATSPNSATKIGNRGFFMGNSHAAHDVMIGDDVIVCNNTVLAGYVSVGNRAFISGNVVVHQFTRIGDLCMLGGSSAAGQDAPPFTMVIGRSQIRNLNAVGMRRAGIPKSTRSEIKKLYGAIFASRGNFDEVLEVVAQAPDIPEINLIRKFYQAKSKRGFMWPPAHKNARLDERQRPQETS